MKIPNLYRLRISSIEITELTDEVLDIIENNEVVANHLHVPLQSGSNFILKNMNRKYDTKYFEEKINYIRSIRPSISISTDVIVGFPGETEEEFLNSYRFCEKMQFSKIHVFPYSVRKNTPASKFPNQIPGNIKKERARKLIELSKKMEEDYMKEFLNTEVEVLMEHSKDHISYGHTSNYLAIKVLGDYNSEDIIKVKISSLEYPNCLGEELIKER